MLVEYRTVQHGRAKSEGILGVVEPPMEILEGPVSQRYVFSPALPARLLISTYLENASPNGGRGRDVLCVQNRMVLQQVRPKACRKTRN